MNIQTKFKPTQISGFPEQLQAADIQRDNRDAIDACRKSATTSQQPVRCTIKIKDPR